MGPAIRRLVRVRTNVWLALALLVTTGAVRAQDFSAVEVTSQPVGEGIHMLMGAGGNLGGSIGPDGVFLIDDQYAPMSQRIRTAVEALGGKAVRFVLNTHWHGDHTGGNEALGETGAVILAHENVRTRMSSEQFIAALDRRIPPSPEAALPVVTFADGLKLHLNGQTIEAIHVAPAHTDGDSIVRFHEANVIHTGDVHFNGMYPFFDQSSGGGIDGMIAAQAFVLGLADEETKIIPGHGPLSSRATLRRQREMLETVRDRVARALAGGKSLEETVASRPTADFDSTYGGGFLKPAQFVGLVYRSLAGTH